MITKIRRKAFGGNLHRPYRRVKPILWIKAGVQGLNRDEVDRYMIKLLDTTDDMKSDYHILLTPTREHLEVEMVVL